MNGFLAAVALCAAVVYFCGFCFRGASPAKTITKVLAILPLVIFVAFLGDRYLLLAALCLCLLGDYLLSLDGDNPFLMGVGAFALGHVAYIALFLIHPLAKPELILQWSYLAVVIILLGVAGFVAPILFRGAGQLRFAVLGYVPMIVGMGIAGLGFAHDLPLVACGALLFVASDLVLGLDMFVLKSNTWAARVAPFWVWSTYWGAQVFIVLGIA
jgi:uncharacterized membrane protein YhhN